MRLAILLLCACTVAIENPAIRTLFEKVLAKNRSVLKRQGGRWRIVQQARTEER